MGNVAAILDAYPNVHLKIGGYTDNTGNADANMKLSAERATNTMQALVGRGIGAERLEAEGLRAGASGRRQLDRRGPLAQSPHRRSGDC